MGVVERKVDCSREFAKALARRLKSKPFKVVLFGSVAKGLGDADSDVDLLAVVDRVTPHKAYKRLNAILKEDELSSEEAEALKRRSSEYMQTYEFHASKSMYALAMFDLEQALQLYVKARLLEEGVAYPRTHSIRRLLELLASVKNDDRLRELVKKYAVELKLLEEAYISSRYVATEFSEEEVVRVKKAVEEVMKHA